MKRLIVNFKNIESTPANMEHSTSVALKYARKHPEAERVSVTWNSPTELYAFTGKRHWDSIELYDLVPRD